MDHIRSKKFLMILILVCVTSYASLYGALTGITSSDASDYLFLALYTTSGSSIPSFMSFIALLGPFVGVILGVDGISGEKSERTLYRIAAQPIYRDSIINGKFLAGTTLIFTMVFAMGISIGALGLLCLGVPPSMEEIARIFCISALYSGLYQFLAGAVPLVFRDLPECGGFRHGVHRRMAVLRAVHGTGGRYGRQSGVSCEQ